MTTSEINPTTKVTDADDRKVRREVCFFLSHYFMPGSDVCISVQHISVGKLLWGTPDGEEGL